MPFEIVGNVIQTTEVLNHEVQATYNVCVRSTDSGSPGLWVERNFTLAVEDVNDPPVAVDDGVAPAVSAGMISPQPDGTWDPIVVVGGVWHEIDVLANDTDEDGHDLLVKKIETAPNPGSARKVSGGAAVEYKGPGDYSGPDQFGYIAVDVPPEGSGFSPAESNEAMVYVNVVADSERGDCNNDGRIDAADFPALCWRFSTSSPNPWHGG